MGMPQGLGSEMGEWLEQTEMENFTRRSHRTSNGAGGDPSDGFPEYRSTSGSPNRRSDRIELAGFLDDRSRPDDSRVWSVAMFCWWGLPVLTGYLMNFP
jgi:hypothetical protein